MILLLIAAMIFIPFGTSALAQSKTMDNNVSAEAMTADLLVIRPLGIVATVVGSAIFIVSLPFSALGGNTKTACRKLVQDPAKFTFKRPLGDF
ncbi:MAG: hypothetical protein JRC56_04655 [Deltaproteobacteria bacterium]|nr:hypothetical protein [Deltaproteobacteria bacterium]MBW2620605.1 hypothetical protein [Deltaproteobacteria bacterium]MBW2643434.1 hypothetical protein [Deltaproteobacteria bacterium]